RDCRGQNLEVWSLGFFWDLEFGIWDFLLLLLRRDHGKIIRAEGRCRQIRLVPQIDNGKIGPAVTNRDRLAHLRTAHDDFVIADLSVRPDEFPVCAADCETL